MAIYDISEVTKVESIDESSSDKEFFKNPEESVVKSLKQKDCIKKNLLLICTSYLGANRGSTDS